MKLIIISGRSGSGKSTAVRALEDSGYNCIDNLPISLLEALIMEYLKEDAASTKLAVCIDARSRSLEKFPDILMKLENAAIERQIIYLDALGPSLVKRFSETRRKHPLTTKDIDLRQAIDMEARILGSVADLANLIIDTTHLGAKQLSDQIKERIIQREESSISLVFRSFGFKHGVPVDTDFVFDLRCLPNPHWEPKLRPLTGLNQEVENYLDEQPMVIEMFDELSGLLKRWIPRFEANERIYMTIGIGCTGGQHRSVYMAEKLARYFKEQFGNVLVRHRELERLKIK
ncbi:MAG: RNase adapter RapZ [Gammaproteobacteria bacterium]|nr:RNase adapter RapZ [Gammaproteobacteria bacterium]|tara:strand:+ start:864 stop:1727 length:864 start_codon:yes stop_codon:yes gene_type:complete